LDAKSILPIVLSGQTTLLAPGSENQPGLNPLYLRLHRKDDIRTLGDEYVIEYDKATPQGGAQKERCVIQWSFKRVPSSP
jgi:hypothetical protein